MTDTHTETARVRLIEPNAAGPELAPLYRVIQAQFGGVTVAGETIGASVYGRPVGLGPFIEVGVGRDRDRIVVVVEWSCFPSDSDTSTDFDEQRLIGLRRSLARESKTALATLSRGPHPSP